MLADYRTAPILGKLRAMLGFLEKLTLQPADVSPDDAVALRAAGLSDEEIARIPKGADAAGWSAADRALLRATDELHGDAFISDATWPELATSLSTQQLMDLVFTIGQYNLVSMALNSFGVQPEPGLAPLPRS